MLPTYILHVTIVYYNMMNATTYMLHITIVYYNIMNATTYILHITIVYYNMYECYHIHITHNCVLYIIT